MRDRYQITISTIYGTKHYNLHQVIKTIIIYFIIFIFILILGGYFYIQYLSNSLEKIELEKQKATRELLVLKNRNSDLKDIIKKRKNEAEELADTIDDLKDKMGLTGKEFENEINISKIDKKAMNFMLKLIPSGKPIDKIRITSRFGWRFHPILKRKHFHTGLDFGKIGKLKMVVKATADGIVEFAGFNKGGYGYMVKISHGFGFRTFYAHMKKGLKVEEGDYVKKGTPLGILGNSGRSTGAHLHYEVRFVDKPLNPINFVQWSGKNFFKIFEKEKRVPWESLVEAITAVKN